jgi:hypothetical protein
VEKRTYGRPGESAEGHHAPIVRPVIDGPAENEGEAQGLTEGEAPNIERDSTSAKVRESPDQFLRAATRRGCESGDGVLVSSGSAHAALLGCWPPVIMLPNGPRKVTFNLEECQT